MAKEKKSVGRPSGYTQKTAITICTRLVEGESLRSICRDKEMPGISTVFQWLGEHTGFAEQYAHARDSQADTLADEIIDIADNCEDVNKARLMVDSRKWIASKLKSKRYGDKVEQLHVGDKDRPIMLTPVDADI